MPCATYAAAWQRDHGDRKRRRSERATSIKLCRIVQRTVWGICENECRAGKSIGGGNRTGTKRDYRKNLCVLWHVPGLLGKRQSDPRSVWQSDGVDRKIRKSRKRIWGQASGLLPVCRRYHERSGPDIWTDESQCGMVQQVVEQPGNDSPAVRRHGIYHGRLCKGLWRSDPAGKKYAVAGAFFSKRPGLSYQ